MHLTLSGNIQQKEEQNPLYIGWVSSIHTALPVKVEGLLYTAFSTCHSLSLLPQWPLGAKVP